MSFIKRNARTVAIRAIQSGNANLLENILQTEILPVTQQVSIRLDTEETQQGVMSYSFSKFSGSRLQQGVCQCGLDIVNSKTYLHQGTLLDLAAANAQIKCCEILRLQGLCAYGEMGQTTPIIQILHNMKHCHPSRQEKYLAILKYFLGTIHAERYTARWMEESRNSRTYKNIMDILYPVNLACILQLPHALELLLSAGFSQCNTTSLQTEPVVLTVERDLNSSVASHQCLELLFKYGLDIQAHPQAPELNYLLMRTTVQKHQVRHLETLLENGLKSDESGLLLMYTLCQKIAMDRNQQIAHLLIQANACEVYATGVNSQYPTPLSIAIIQHPSLVMPLLECGIPVCSYTGKTTKDRLEPSWFKQARFRLLRNALQASDFCDIKLAKTFLGKGHPQEQFLMYIENIREIQMSLSYKCRKVIRKSLGYCNDSKLNQLNIPPRLVNFILLRQ